jgi:anaerobic selenocysteine-containing dehydrogenase
MQLSTAAERGETVTLSKVQAEAALRPQENELLAVPVTKLYDRGLTVAADGLLKQRVGEAAVALHPEAAKRLGVEAGQRVTIHLAGVDGEAVVRIDDTISTGVVLVPRSMGLAIREPVSAKVK